MKKHLQKLLYPAILLSSSFCFIDAQEILFQDAVENDGTWTNVWGGFYPTMSEETGKFNSLGPIEGETYWTATTVNVAARGLRHTLIGEMIKPGTYHLEFWVGVTGAQWFANRQGPVSGISSDADFAINPNDFSTLLQNLDDSIILAKRFVTPPNEALSDAGWEKWTITTVVPEGASVVDTELGILVVFPTGTVDASVHAGAAVDSMKLSYYDDVSLWPEPLFPSIENGFKDTAIGLIWDGWYPWVYSNELESWLYISMGSNPFISDGGWYAWDANGARWIHSAEDYMSYFWDYASSSWKTVFN
jgi:hypothetical protein